jgi:hypothetical protein
VGFEFANRVDADDMVQQALKAGRPHGGLQHGGISIAQDAGGNTAGFEPLQHRQVFRESPQVLVGGEQMIDFRPKSYKKLAFSPCIYCICDYLLYSEYQGGASECTEGLVMRAVVAGGDQPGVLNLFVAPQQTQSLAMTGEQFFGQLRHAVHVKQRAVSIKQYGPCWRRWVQGCSCRRRGRGRGHPQILRKACRAIAGLVLHAAVTKRRVIREFIPLAGK